MVDGGEEFFDITLENPSCPRMITGNLVGETSETIQSPVDSFLISAGIRIGDKKPVEKRIQNTIDSPMDNPVSNLRFMNVSWLRVGNVEGFVARVPIGSGSKLAMERKKIISQP